MLQVVFPLTRDSFSCTSQGASAGADAISLVTFEVSIIDFSGWHPLFSKAMSFAVFPVTNVTIIPAREVSMAVALAHFELSFVGTYFRRDLTIPV